MHPDLLIAKETIYLTAHRFVKEAESAEYGAFDFEMEGRRIKFRTGKVTPTKSGQFVTLWKRVGKGPIQPFDSEDPIDLFVISVRMSDRLGQFVFPKEVLVEKGIVSREGRGGKRAMRIYPPWDIAENKQAKNTQAWQVHYFYEIGVDSSRLKTLFLMGHHDG